jgi:hypothetical protein
LNAANLAFNADAPVLGVSKGVMEGTSGDLVAAGDFVTVSVTLGAMFSDFSARTTSTEAFVEISDLAILSVFS